jgi:hypothetical protein
VGPKGGERVRAQAGTPGGEQAVRGGAREVLS